MPDYHRYICQKWSLARKDTGGSSKTLSSVTASVCSLGRLGLRALYSTHSRGCLIVVKLKTSFLFQGQAVLSPLRLVEQESNLRFSCEQKVRREAEKVLSHVLLSLCFAPSECGKGNETPGPPPGNTEEWINAATYERLR